MAIEQKKRSEIELKDTWDLEAMIKDSEEYEKIYNETQELINKIESYRGKITSSSTNLLEFLNTYMQLDRFFGLIYIYSSMKCDEDSTNDDSKSLKGRAEKLSEEINDKISFVTPEIISSTYEHIKKLISEKSELEKYSFYFEKFFRYEKHTLNSNEEEIIAKATNAMGVGDEVFYNLDNTDIKLGYIKDENGELVELTNSNYNKYLSGSNRDVRKLAFDTMYKYFENFKNTFAASLKGNIKENFFLSKVRKYNSPLEASLYEDNISVDVYNTLIKTLHDKAYIMHDYMKFRKDILELDELHMYDLYVDLAKEQVKDIPFEEGQKMVFEGLKPLGEDYLNDLKKAFLERWIDIYPNIGKKSGAYSWGSYDSHPYLLLNYDNSIDSISTMAHELGHSMHSYYSKKNNPFYYAVYPIFLAEIASTVNEVLLNEYLYKNAKTDEEKISYLTEFLDKVRTTIFRQTMFAEFESVMHDKQAAGIPLTAKEFSDTYYKLNQEYYGPHVTHDDSIRYEWARIPHFYSSFYVYKYATGLAAAIAIAYNILDNKAGIKDSYLEFLKSGGKDYPLNILKKVGVDMTTNEPILKALEVFENKLNELKKLKNND